MITPIDTIQAVISDIDTVTKDLKDKLKKKVVKKEPIECPESDIAVKKTLKGS